MIELHLTGAMPRGLRQQQLVDACQAALRIAKQPMRGMISVSFISDEEMKALNTKYRQKRKTTDVLSFPEPEVPGGRRSWGDIFISTAYVKGEAERRGISLVEEVLRVLVHGVLHLVGYDHVTDEEETEMFSLQEHALAKVVDV